MFFGGYLEGLYVFSKRSWNFCGHHPCWKMVSHVENPMINHPQNHNLYGRYNPGMVGLWQVYHITFWSYLQLDKWDTLRQATTNPVWSQDCHPGIVQHSHLWSHNFYGKKQHNLDLFTHDWLVVYLLLWKIWKSLGMIILNIEKCLKPPTNVWNHQPDEYWAFDQFIQYGSYWVILQQYPKMGTNLGSTPHCLIFVSINEFSHLTVMIPCIEASDSPMTWGRGRSSRFFAFWSTNFGGWS